MDATILHQGARAFEAQGFASFRYDQYSWRKDSRNLVDSTVDLLAGDLDQVVAYFRKRKFQKIIVIGHSLGAWIILKSPMKGFDGVVFWDGSYKLNKIYRKRFVPGVGCVQKWGIDIAFGKKWIDEAQAFTKPELSLRGIKCPIKLIYSAGPGGGGILDGAKAYYREANSPKSLTILKTADHNFCNDGVVEKLTTTTIAWLRRYFK